MAEPFKCFVGKPVKVCFIDGRELRVKHGVLISVSDGFATLDTPHGACAIRISEVTKIQQTTAPVRDEHG